MKRGNLTNIVLGIASFVNYVSAERISCTSNECFQASAQILERINIDADPCDNFYNFACGSFIDGTLVPDESATVNSLSQYKDKIDQLIFSKINKGQPSNALDQLGWALNEACTRSNSDKAEEDGQRELREMIGKLGGWPLINGLKWNDTKWLLSEKIQDIREIFAQRSDKIIDIKSFILLMQDGNDHPHPLIRSTVISYSKYLDLYRIYIFKSAHYLASLSDSNIYVNKTEIDEMLDFENKLNKFNYRIRILSNGSNFETQPKDFIATLFALRWLEFFHPSPLQIASQINEIDSKDVMDEFRNLLNNTSPRTQANFLIWRLLDYAGPQVAGTLKLYKFQLEQAINGRLDIDQKWQRCLNVVLNELPYVADVLITRNIDPNLKNNADRIYNHVRDEFTKLIANAEWLNEAVKEKIQSKLQTLVPLISHPTAGFNESEIVNFYKDAKINSNQYIATLLQLRIIDADEKFRQTYAAATVNDIDNWRKYLPSSSLTTFYSASDNTLRISTSALLMYIYANESMKYLNYGSTGFIIAHEISHIVNQFINRANAWPEKYRNEFMEREQCLIDQYSDYQDPETLKMLDGKRTVSENIADLTSIRLAYGALKRWTREFNGTNHKIIGIYFTPNQIFWIVMAQNFCSVNRPEEIERQIASDIYAPERFRVIGMLQNSADFAVDFECSETSAMNRANKRCVIW